LTANLVLTYAIAALLSALALSVLIVAVGTGVPPYPARRREITEVLSLLERANLDPGTRLAELGAGWGTLGLAIARRFPTLRVTGYEISPVPFLCAKIRARSLPNLDIRFGDFHKVDLRPFGAVAAYLMIKPMPRVAKKLDDELAAGASVVTLGFWFRGRTPTETEGASALYRW
jgi:hypothetical protein